MFKIFFSTLFFISFSSYSLEPVLQRVVLEVSGKITETNSADGKTAEFDRLMLQALPQRKTVTHTPWYDDKSVFEGPLISALLDHVGASGTNLRVIALNDYEVSIPVQDFYDNKVILAMSRNGNALSVREHGPLFIIYPFDEHPDLLNENILSRSVWQIKAVVVE